MPRLQHPQIMQLHQAIVTSFEVAPAQSQLRTLMASAAIIFEQYQTPNAVFSETVMHILQIVNERDGGLDLLLTTLSGSSYGTVAMTARHLLLAAPPATPFRATLASAGLLVEEDPFVDRDHLRNTLIPSLLDPTQVLRAVIIRGPADCGKSFSLRPLRVSSRARPGAGRF